MGFKVWTQDVTQAYLKSAGILAREVYVYKPAPELELNTDQALKLLIRLYGLADSGDFWYRELANHHQKMGMRTLATDQSLWLNYFANVLDGLSAFYADDVLQARTPQLDWLTDSLSSNYDDKNKEYGCSRIAGI
jgi:hypothetical protein